MIVATSLTSGVRAIEVTDLKPEYFVVPKGFKGKIFTEIKIGPAHNCRTKRSTNRTISMPVWLMKEVSDYHTTDRYKERKALYYMLHGDDNAPAFITKEGNPFKVPEKKSDTLNTLWSRLRTAIRENSNPHFNHEFHDCRCTFIAYKLESLMD